MDFQKSVKKSITNTTQLAIVDGLMQIPGTSYEWAYIFDKPVPCFEAGAKILRLELDLGTKQLSRVVQYGNWPPMQEQL